MPLRGRCKPMLAAAPTKLPSTCLPLAVRTKAMEVLGKCHAQLGPSLVDFLEGLKPAQLMALEEHFRQNPLAQVRFVCCSTCRCHSALVHSP